MQHEEELALMRKKKNPVLESHRLIMLGQRLEEARREMKRSVGDGSYAMNWSNDEKGNCDIKQVIGRLDDMARDAFHLLEVIEETLVELGGMKPLKQSSNCCMHGGSCKEVK